jgi:hypothetical protein
VYIISHFQLKINYISANQANGLIPFAQSATSLGASPHHCEAHYLRKAQHRSFVPRGGNEVELMLK